MNIFIYSEFNEKIKYKIVKININKKSSGDHMCESTVYSTDKNMIMEDVLNIKIQGNKIHLTDILGMEKELTGVIVEIDLDKHGIYIDLK